MEHMIAKPHTSPATCCFSMIIHNVTMQMNSFCYMNNKILTCKKRLGSLKRSGTLSLMFKKTCCIVVFCVSTNLKSIMWTGFCTVAALCPTTVGALDEFILAQLSEEMRLWTSCIECCKFLTWAIRGQCLDRDLPYPWWVHAPWSLCSTCDSDY